MVADVGGAVGVVAGDAGEGVVDADAGPGEEASILRGGDEGGEGVGSEGGKERIAEVDEEVVFRFLGPVEGAEEGVEDDPANPKHILTIYGVGYKLSP